MHIYYDFIKKKSVRNNNSLGWLKWAIVTWFSPAGWLFFSKERVSF